MKFLSLLMAVLLIGFPLLSSGDDDWKRSITPEMALKAINAFRADPDGEHGRGYLSVIVNFAEESDLVLVKIDPDQFPADFKNLDSQWQGTLLGAFVAGNIEPQLLFDEKSDSPLEGIRLMLSSYRHFESAGRIEKLPSFEEWIRLDAHGKLLLE